MFTSLGSFIKTVFLQGKSFIQSFANEASAKLAVAKSFEVWSVFWSVWTPRRRPFRFWDTEGGIFHFFQNTYKPNYPSNQGENTCCWVFFFWHVELFLCHRSSLGILLIEHSSGGSTPATAWCVIKPGSIITIKHLSDKSHRLFVKVIRATLTSRPAYK